MTSQQATALRNRPLVNLGEVWADVTRRRELWEAFVATFNESHSTNLPARRWQAAIAPFFNSLRAPASRVIDVDAITTLTPPEPRQLATLPIVARLGWPSDHRTTGLLTSSGVNLPVLAPRTRPDMSTFVPTITLQVPADGGRRADTRLPAVSLAMPRTHTFRIPNTLGGIGTVTQPVGVRYIDARTAVRLAGGSLVGRLFRLEPDGRWQILNHDDLIDLEDPSVTYRVGTIYVSS